MWQSHKINYTRVTISYVTRDRSVYKCSGYYFKIQFLFLNNWCVINIWQYYVLDQMGTWWGSPLFHHGWWRDSRVLCILQLQVDHQESSTSAPWTGSCQAGAQCQHLLLTPDLDNSIHIFYINQEPLLGLSNRKAAEAGFQPLFFILFLKHPGIWWSSQWWH